MANPNSPELKAQHKALSDEIEAKKAEIEANPDNEALEDELDALEDQMSALNRQMKDFRATGRAERKGQGGGRATAPGQQKKQP